MDILDGARDMEAHFLVDGCGDNCAELIAKEPGSDVDRLKLEVSPQGGSLLGLTPWRDEAVALALHADWLQRKFWRTNVSISFPRLRAAAGGFEPDHPIGDAELLQLACAFRLFLPDVGLVLSTRENAAFRDGIAPICITMMSAGSRTEPGGYTKPGEAEKQFNIEDKRTPEEVARMLDAKGLEPVWKDWDRAFAEG